MASPTDQSVSSISSNPAVMTDESKGSSVSTVLREEYEDLLRYAVVTPLVDSKVVKHHSPDRNVILPSPRVDSRMENVVKTTHPRPTTPQKPEVKFVDVPASTTTSDLSTVQNVHSAEDSCSSFLSENIKHVVPPYPSHRMNAFERVVAPTCERMGMPSGPQCHRHHSHPHPSPHQHPPLPPEDTRLPEKQQHHHHNHSHHHIVCEQDVDSVQQLIVDPEMGRLDKEMDACWRDLKKKVSAEFEQSRIRVVESQQARLIQEREKRLMEMKMLKEEMCRYKEMALSYEHSLNSKDQIIENLTLGLHKAKERLHKQHVFSQWHHRHVDEKRERFCSVLASKHHGKKILGCVLVAWSSLIKNSWKFKTEKACQLKAEEVCLKLTRQHEEQLEKIKASLEDSERKCAQFRGERDNFEVEVKRAFMRGVCALNLEAMTVLKPNEQNQLQGMCAVDPHEFSKQQGPPAAPPTSVPPQARRVTDTYKRTHQVTTQLPMLNVEGKGLTTTTSTSDSFPQDSWSKLNKWAESLGVPPEMKGHGDRFGCWDAGRQEKPLSGRSGGRSAGLRSGRRSPAMAIKGTVKGYLRPTVVIEKHSD